MHLFEPFQSVWFNLGGDIYKPRPVVRPADFDNLWWSADAETPRLFVEAMKKEILPKLAQINSVSQYVDYARSISRHSYDKRFWQKPIIDTALGNLDDARAICSGMISKMTAENWCRDEDDKAQLGRLQQLCRLLAADDRAGLAALLHEWEAITVRNLKIEHLWERTPFPLEQA